MKNKSTNYEDMFKQLEEIVEELNDNNLPLDLTMTKYQDGMSLCKKLYKILDDTEKQIKIIVDGEERDYKTVEE